MFQLKERLEYIRSLVLNDKGNRWIFYTLNKTVPSIGGKIKFIKEWIFPPLTEWKSPYIVLFMRPFQKTKFVTFQNKCELDSNVSIV